MFGSFSRDQALAVSGLLVTQTGGPNWSDPASYAVRPDSQLISYSAPAERWGGRLDFEKSFETAAPTSVKLGSPEARWTSTVTSGAFSPSSARLWTTASDMLVRALAIVAVTGVGISLAWLLDQVTIPEDLSLPGGVPARDLRAWLGGLVERLRRFAHPGP